MFKRSFAAVLLAAFGLAGPVSAQAPNSGQEMFKQNCSACHQVDGKGVPGAFPALAGNAFVQGPAQPVAATVLNGRGGMPSFRDELSKDQIAAILTYVRGAWGNAAAAIDAATVTDAPGGTAAAAEAPSVLGFH